MIPLHNRTHAVILTLASAAAIALPAATASAAPAPGPSGRHYTAPVKSQLPFSWVILDSGSFGNIVSVDVASEDAAWAVTSDTAEVLLTTDGGDTFDNVADPAWASEGLQLYDVEAASADEAIVLASGTGPLSRLFHTPDGGATWHEAYRASDPNSFINCVAMFDDMRGYAVGDPIGGKYQIVTTDDGGMSWSDVDPSVIPDAQDGEYEWAASGSCANASGKKGWFGTGNASVARVIWTDDFGASWNLSETPMTSGPGAGIFGVDFRTNKLGIAVGGDFGTGAPAMVRTTDGGRTWSNVADLPASSMTGIAWWQDQKGDTRQMVPPVEQKTVFVVGIFGSEVSQNRGKTWEPFDSTSLNTISCLQGSAVCMAGGGGGTMAMLAVG